VVAHCWDCRFEIHQRHGWLSLVRQAQGRKQEPHRNEQEIYACVRSELWGQNKQTNSVHIEYKELVLFIKG